MPKYEVEGELRITLGHLPYPRPVFIFPKGKTKALNLADELYGWDGKKVKLSIEEPP